MLGFQIFIFYWCRENILVTFSTRINLFNQFFIFFEVVSVKFGQNFNLFCTAEIFRQS